MLNFNKNVLGEWCEGVGTVLLHRDALGIVEVKGTIEVAQVRVLRGHPGPRGRAGQRQRQPARPGSCCSSLVPLPCADMAREHNWVSSTG